MSRRKVFNFFIKQKRKKCNSSDLYIPPAAIPDAAPRASNSPTARNGVFGRESISSVTIPA